MLTDGCVPPPPKVKLVLVGKCSVDRLQQLSIRRLFGHGTVYTPLSSFDEYRIS
jgi:hypothetical protein